jgi:pimeloyl-ACP methyl ester carboxylesterase
MLSARYGVDRFIRVEGYRIHYVEVGVGYPVILIPGSYGTYRTWNRIIPLLSDHCRLLAVDYVGTGDSDKPQKGFRYTIQEQSHVTAMMIEQLHLGKAHIVGVSYGGAIALSLAARYPGLVSKVVSIEGGVVKPQRLPGNLLESILRYPVFGDLFISIVKTQLLDRVFLRLVAGRWYPRLTVDDRKELLEQLSHNVRSASRIPWYWISVSHRTCEDFEEAAKSIGAPVLYIYGTESDFMDTLVADNIRFFENYLPHVQIVGLEGGIHDLEIQMPKDVAALVLTFLEEAEG